MRKTLQAASSWLGRGLAVTSALAGASAMASLVANGSFENTTPNISATTPWSCPSTAPCIVDDWSLAGAPNLYGQMVVHPSFVTNGYLFPANYFYLGSQQVGIAGTLPLSPDGGNFIFSDADFQNSPIDQLITGLTPGALYLLTFYQALAQDTEPGITTPGLVSANWNVSLGSSAVQSSAGMTANGITNTVSPWAQQSMYFTANTASELLRFVSVGSGDPPLIALDGVRLERVPEPGTWLLAALGLVLTGATYRRTRWQRLRASQVG